MYRPKFKAQWNDPTTTLDWQNCTMASGAMAIDFDTLGHVDVMGGTLRAASGDTVGGTTLDGLAKAWAHFGQTLSIQTGNDWADVIVALKGSRGVVLQGMYGALPKAYHSPLNSLTFTGPHAIYLNPEFSATGDILMGDPLNNQYIWVPQSALQAFANALGSHELGASSPQRIFFATTDAHVPPPPPPADPSVYVHTVEVTARPYVNIRETASASSADVGNLATGARVKTTHLCKNGGKYTVDGVVRTDWLGFMHDGEEDWIARAYTKVII